MDLVATLGRIVILIGCIVVIVGFYSCWKDGVRTYKDMKRKGEL